MHFRSIEQIFVTDPHVNQDGGPDRTSSSLLERARLRDHAAWERLVGLYTPLVYRWCRNWGLQSQDAENVGQEVFLAVARKLQDFRRDRPHDTFRGWLWRIARNRFLDHVRATGPDRIGVGGSDARARIEQLELETECDAGESELAEEHAILCQRAVQLIHGEFSEQDWNAFNETAINDRRPADVAADQNRSVNAIYLARSRILRRLREEFGDMFDSEIC